MNLLDRLPHFSRRTSMRVVNTATILLACVLLVWKGLDYFPNNADPALYKAILYTLTAASGILALWVTYKSGANNLLTAVFKMLAVGVIVMGGTWVAGAVLTVVKPVETGQCPQLFELADSLQKEGNLAGAESLLNDCIMSPDTPPRYIEEGNIRLAQIYIAQTNEYLDQNVCQEEFFQERLSRALNIAQKYNQAFLEQLIEEKREEASLVCNRPLPISTPLPDTYAVDVLRAQQRGNAAVIDLQVIRNHTDKVSDLGEANFQLLINNSPVPITNFSARNTDDPVCLIAVVDNSGSINSVNPNGVDRIRNALRTLNQLQKPNDEIGLVIFGEPDHVRTIRQPANGNLSESDINLVDASDELTALWAGVEQGLNAVRQCISQNRYMIVLTDGGNNVSYPYAGNDAARYLANQAKADNINICTVGIKSKDLEETPLVYLAQAGCDYFSAEALDKKGGEDNLASLLRSIIGYVREFYRIELPASQILGGQPLLLKVTINGQFASQAQITFGK
ncbi:MAG: VWA domain-containing protein [Anaerolineales bacterium]|nr:VWA domain-containing protein [Anaerolineales bacterium]